MGIFTDNKIYQEEIKPLPEGFPSVMKNTEEKYPLEKAFFVSAILHPLIPFLIWLIIGILALFGLNLSLFKKPEIKPRDVTFVLVTNHEKPINKKTKFRSNTDSRAGGKHDKRFEDSTPETAGSTSKAVKSTSKTQSAMKAPALKTHQQNAAPKVPNLPPRPIFQPKMFSPPKLKTENPFSVPAPKIAAPKAISPVGGPVSTGLVGTSRPSGNPYASSGTGSSSGSSGNTRGTGGSSGNGHGGNPGAGNSSGFAGIDAIKDVDLTQYKLEMEQRIKRNWHPPYSSVTRKTVVLFKLNRSGRLLSLNIYKSSGSTEIDDAALNTIRICAPFKQLPPEYKESTLDVQYVFNLNTGK